MKLSMARMFRYGVVFIGMFISSTAFSLTCPQIKDLINISLKAHLSFHDY